MRIKGKFEIESGQPGKVTLMLDNNDDLWHLFNIIQKGDFVKMKTFRKVVHEHSSGTKSSEKKRIDITIKLEEIDYDQIGEEIRLKGKNVAQSQHINIGQYQTFSIIKHVPFTIYKKFWDDIHIEKLKIASDPTITSDLAAVVMEEGLANIFLVSSHTTTCKATLESSIAKKRKGATQHDKTLTKFFQSVLDHIVSDVNFDIVKCLVIGSPGFTKDQFANFLADKCNTNNDAYKPIKLNMNKILYVHTSSGYKSSLQEILAKPDILTKIKETKAMDDVIAMEKYNEILGKDMDRIVFGYKAVKEAYERKAIDLLLVSDDFLRKLSITHRKEITKLMKDLEKDGAKINKMSSRHITGEKLNALGGITAILKYSIPELNEVEEENVFQEDTEEEDDMNLEQLKRLDLNNNDDEMNFSDDDKKKEDGAQSEKVVLVEEKKNLEKEEMEKEVDEYAGLGGLKKDKNFKDKSKRKSSKLEKKEREVQRMVNSRKKSEFDDNF